VTERMFGRRRAGDGWNLRVERKGRGCLIVYREGTNQIDFDFELGDAGTIYCPPSADWDQKFRWAAGRRREIMERVGAEFVRREFRGHTFEIGGAGLLPRLGSDRELVGFDMVHTDDVIVIRRTLRGSSRVSSRLRTAVPLGLILGALAWVTAAWGVHAYDAPRLQRLLLFPAALFGPVALVVHGLQWIGYAFLMVSIAKESDRRRYLVILSVALISHVAIGLVTARAV
jgi:hypothetical protein